MSGEREDGGCETGEVTGDTVGEIAGELVTEVGETVEGSGMGNVGCEVDEENKVVSVLEEAGEPGQVKEAVGAVGELGEAGKVTGELCEESEVAGDQCKAGKVMEAGERERQAGELCEGGAEAEAEDMEACEAGGSSAPLKRRTKRKNVVIVMASGKAGRLAGTPNGAESRPACLSDSSDGEGCVSDSSSLLSHSQQAAAQVHPATILKAFLQKTKGMKGLILEQYFPDLQGFYNSARSTIKHRAESDLTDQEIFRLRKQMMKVRKQLGL